MNNQEQIVLEIVKTHQPIRTEWVKIRAMEKGVSCADRYLRYLSCKKQIESYKVEGDKTKTWKLPTQFNYEGNQGVFV